MTEMRIYAGEQGDSVCIHVDWSDHNNVKHTFPIEVETQKQDKPRIVGVKVAGRPVLLTDGDVVYHSGAPLETDQPSIVRAIARRFNCFGKGSGDHRDDNPLTIWMKSQPLSFALGVDVSSVVRFVIEYLNGDHR